eukprot:CAMPEP_0203666784 /NCGR_PEP_ID=MMETSP0090-20130426/3769_1 /ASSEMBLY_ACC=CAM_ASM_001088 /TAXON_ID=426623 /ORGANISM="Chaetoceros affinis, Strain CCMP159" /LENGTH=579 /DNA_ID=CAMNT_0050530775 /DNA_START=25 /DNA_END=1761 /DNA_ORIENTATION=-
MSSRSNEKALIYAAATVFAMYIFLTIKSFQKLPAIPSLEDALNINNLHISDDIGSDNGADSTAKIAGAVNTNTEDIFNIEELAKHTPFPQKIHFPANNYNRKNKNAFKETSNDADNTVLSNQLEYITHPAVELLPSLASDVDKLIVPKFFDPPIFKKYGGIRSYLGEKGRRLMTLKEAKTIGSFVQLDASSKSASASSEPLETIFVAIASYRDFQCRQTIESILSRATHPQRIRIAVVDQLDYGSDTPCSKPEVPCDQNPDQILCAYSSQIDFFEMDASYAVGPVFARHLGHRLYRGEYFAMQCDAHVDFIKGWDVTVIDAWRSAKNEMAVLTTYLSDVHGAMDDEGNLKVMSRPVMCMSDYEGHGVTKHLRHGQQPEGITRIKGEPTIEPFWAAGFSFSRGHFIINVPYDQHLPWVFQGEEISIGLRGFTYGYDYYAPEHSVCFHYYASKDTTGKRNKVNLFWEHSRMFSQEGNVVEKKGMMRLNGILNMNPPSVTDDQWLHDDEEFYGLGKVRSTEKFFETFGIHTEEQKIEHHLCRFVGKNMQKKWKPFLRKDTMGIDYDKIHYKFKDPDIHGITW